MNPKYIHYLFVNVLLMFVLAACTQGAENTARKANEEIVNNASSLSSDLVNNPISADATPINADAAGRLQFTDTVYDFGTLSEGEMIVHEFEYKNIGGKELIITEAKGSCGCTVPEYDNKPIPPGGTGIMKVTFDSKGKPGYNEKNVHITTNGFPQKYRLTILAQVN